MLMLGWAYPTIFYPLDYCSIPTFHRQSRYGAKNLFFSAVEAVVHTWQNAWRSWTWRSTSLCFDSYGTQCPCFWIIPNTFKRFDSLTCIIWPSSASAWDQSSSSNSSNSLSSHFFGAPESSLTSRTKIITFEASKPFSACCIRQSIVTISINKESMCFSCRFLWNKVVQ